MGDIGESQLADGGDDDVDMQEIEERLYGNIHHAAAEEPTTSSLQAEPVRLSDATVVSSAQRLNQNLKRYWSSISNVATNKRPFSYSASTTTPNKPRSPAESVVSKAKSFVPYTSILSGIGLGRESESSSEKDAASSAIKTTEPEKAEKKSRKVINPTNPANKGKIERMNKMQKKKIKADIAKSKPKVMCTITLDTSEEEADADVIEIKQPPPPLVCIESSDDDTEAKIKKEFTEPNKMSKKKKKKGNSPRCLSPSSSSIQSDDFIGHNDRSRLNESYNQMAGDDELECNAAPTVDSVLNPAPGSVSSEQTSSSTAAANERKETQISDNAKTSSEVENHSECSNSSDMMNNLRVIKEHLTSKQETKKADDDSVYTTKGNVAKRRKSRESKGAASPPSDSDEKKSKSSRRRKKIDSELYSDENFVTMLTDIVDASDNEEDAEPTFMFPFPSADIDEVEDKDDDIVEVRVEKPSTITLPQVEKGEEIKKKIEEHFNFLPKPVCYEVEEEDEEKKLKRIAKEKKLQGPDWNDPEICWNDEMKKFYNHSWNCENFNISTVMFNMPRHVKHWPINQADRYPDPQSNKKGKIICYNCNMYGHSKFKCKQKLKPIVCHMCGGVGHIEPRCPNTMCLNCGNAAHTFLKECRHCSKEKDFSCSICNLKGHPMTKCPDKWRRFHSTTEDHVPLNQHVQPNPNSNHCSICAKSGHTAHLCRSNLKIFRQVVHTNRTQSYSPVYPMRWEQKQLPNEYNFNTFSDLVDFDLKFDEKFVNNSKSFYNRFSRAVGLDRKRKKLAAKLKKKEEKMRKKDLEEAGPSGEAPKNADEENSNYSFSVLTQGQEVVAPPPPQISDKLPDFIPLSSEQTATPTVEDSDAKIFLSKSHAKILLAEEGAAFLKTCAIRYKLKLSISFESLGNVLLAIGLSKNQDDFHQELIQYLITREKQSVNVELSAINNVPKTPSKVFTHIQTYLDMLNKKYETANALFTKLKHFEKMGQCKASEKLRRTLNIVLFGQKKMRDGQIHLDSLRAISAELATNKEPKVSADLREKVNVNLRYIFSTFDHENYDEIMDELTQKEVEKSKKAETAMDDLILNVSKQSPRKDQQNSSTGLLFGAPNKGKPSAIPPPPVPPIFNPPKGQNNNRSNNNKNNNSGSIETLNKMKPPPLLPTPPALPFLNPPKGQNNPQNNNRKNNNNDGNLFGTPNKFKAPTPQTPVNLNPPQNNNRNNNNNRFNNNRNQNNFQNRNNENWRTLVPTLIKESRLLARNLNNSLIEANFEKVFVQAERSNLMYQDYKSLLDVYGMLKDHLNTTQNQNQNRNRNRRPPCRWNNKF